jgi:YegS/Rv2252/BmrU family lipid kinase
VIVNPRSGRGMSEQRWGRLAGGLAEALSEFDSVFTTGPRDATTIARREAGAGRRLIVALGGDGTVSEVADGILGAHAGGTADLGIIPRGTGGDFSRMLQLPSDPFAAARRIREGRVRVVDAGRARYIAHDGSPAVCHFVNVASFGFSSAVASRANASSKRFGAKAAFLAATVRSLFSYDNTDVWLASDGSPRQRRRILMAAAGNGCYFGAGMKICPNARLDDGALDLVVIGDFSRTEVLLEARRLYDGSHLALEDVTSSSARIIEVAPADPDAIIAIELDGETLGRLPATFEILPGALRVRA